MDPCTFFLLTKIILGLATVKVITVVVARLTFKAIVNWFHQREKLATSDKNNRGFTLQEQLKNGQYKTIQGILNKQNGKVLDAQEIQSEKIDEEVANIHRGTKLVLYN